MTLEVGRLGTPGTDGCSRNCDLKQVLARKVQDGFTYLGVLIVIAVIGAIAAHTLSVGAAMQRRVAEEELLFIGLQFQTAFKTYYEATPAGKSPYPNRLSDLLRDPRYPIPRRHLRKIFTDPLTGKADWGTLEAPGGGIMGVHSFSGDRPIKVAEFETALTPLEGKNKYSEWVFMYQSSSSPSVSVSEN